MKVLQQITAVFTLALLMGFIAFGNAIPAIANTVTSSVPSLSIEKIVNTSSNSQDIKRFTELEKRVCRYVDGQKRCWDD